MIATLSRLRRRWLALVYIVVFFLLPTAALADSGPLVVGPGQQVNSDVATVTQPIEIAGTVDGDVTSWSGDILVTGQVNGDVVSYIGKVVIAAGGKVGGSVMSVGGTVERHTLAQVARAEIGGNENVALTSMVGLMLPQSRATTVDQPVFGGIILGLVAAVLLSAFTLLWGTFWPNRTLASALMLRVFPARSLIVGMLATLATALLVPPLFGLLAASLLGLPLLVLALFLINVPYIYGLAATARFIAVNNRARSAQDTPSPIAIGFVAMVGVVVALATTLSPMAGVLTFYALASPGLGAVLLSRGGLLAPVGLQLR